MILIRVKIKFLFSGLPFSYLINAAIMLISNKNANFLFHKTSIGLNPFDTLNIIESFERPPTFQSFKWTHSSSTSSNDVTETQATIFYLHRNTFGEFIQMFGAIFMAPSFIEIN